jgi:hypothetical protein
VFFVRVPAKVCPVALERVPSAGGTATRLTTVGFPGGPVAVSQDGRMLAYTGTRPGTCHPHRVIEIRPQPPNSSGEHARATAAD